MPSRSIVSRAARAVGITVKPSLSSSSSVGVAIASISGTMSCGRSRSTSARKRSAIEHVDHVRAMRDLHRRRVGVAIDRDHFAAEALQLDRDFLAELARAEQHHASAEGASGVPIVVMICVCLEHEGDER